MVRLPWNVFKCLTNDAHLSFLLNAEISRNTIIIIKVELNLKKIINQRNFAMVNLV